MRKKSFSLVLVTLCMFCFNLCSVFAINEIDNEVTSISVPSEYCNQYEVGSQFISAYYSSINCNTNLGLYNYVEDGSDLFKYITQKCNFLRKNIEINKFTIKDFSCNTTCTAYNLLDNSIEFFYYAQVNRRINDMENLSCMCRTIRLTISLSNNKIIDFYEYDDFDNIWLDKTNNNSNDNIIFKNIDFNNMQIFINTQNNNMLNLVNTEKNNINNNLCVMAPSMNTMRTMSTVSYNQRSQIANYAINNCKKTNPTSGNSAYASYVDFTTLNGYDCTNFASHSLLAGGAVEKNTGDRNTGWFFNGTATANRSASWSGVVEFNNFLTSNTGTGPKGQNLTLNYNVPSSNTNWLIGDIIQIKYNGNTQYGHTTIITNCGYNADGYTVFPIISSRSGASMLSSSNQNEPLTTAYPLYTSVQSYRLIHITSLT